jgi:hypothetical protein
MNESTKSTETETTTTTDAKVGIITRMVMAVTGALAWAWAALIGIPKAMGKVAKVAAITVGAAVALLVVGALIVPAPTSASGATALLGRAVIAAESEAIWEKDLSRTTEALRAKAAAEGHTLSRQDVELLERKLQHLLDSKGSGSAATALNLPLAPGAEGSLRRYIAERTPGMVSGSTDQDLRVLAEVAPEMGLEVRTHRKGSGWLGSFGEKIGLGHIGAKPLF